ncbi:MAG: 2Fe-2S iron-sulfur cluster-binding protein [Burkholderiales bacterium]
MESYEIAIEGAASGFRASGQDPLLRSALRAGIGFPYECNVGSCGSCKFELLDGELDVPAELTSGTSERDRQRRRFLACQVKPASECRIKVRTSVSFEPVNRPRAVRAELVRRIDHTGDLSEFVFQTLQPALFLSGQYALLSLPGVQAWRAYSMSNLSNDDGEWRFFIKRVAGGAMTQPLFESPRAGTVVTIDGPYGMAFARLDVERDAVCIAGGSGFSPMLGIARCLAASGNLRRRNLHFFYGCRTPDDQPDASLVGNLREQVGSLSHTVVVSDTAAASTFGWTGPTGFVHETVASHIGSDGAALEYYVSGPAPMVDAVVRMLVLDRKVPVEQVHYDRFF